MYPTTNNISPFQLTISRQTSCSQFTKLSVALLLNLGLLSHRQNSLKDLPIVYIDETRIDRYLYRPYARAPRGDKVYEKISGRRFERTSIVARQVDGDFIAPMIYKDSMTIDFFVEWFKTQLLPALKTSHVIVMDNASFHPKNIN